MADDPFAQIVCVKTNGELPVGLTAFRKLSTLADDFARFQQDGYGSRQQSHPVLEIRGRDGKKLTPPKPAEK